MADNVDEKHVLAVLPAFLDWWRGDEGDDTPYAICGAVLDALRSLPVEQRVAVMGLQPFTNNHLTALYEAAGSKPPALWVEADRG